MSEPAYAVFGVESDVHVRQPEDAVDCIECVDCKLRPNLLRDNLAYGFIAEGRPSSWSSTWSSTWLQSTKVPTYALTQLLEESRPEPEDETIPIPDTKEQMFDEASAIALLVAGMAMVSIDNREMVSRIQGWVVRLGKMRLAYALVPKSQ